MATRNSSISNASVAALFSNESAAEQAVSDLKQAGFSPDDIGIATIGGNTGTADERKGSFWDKVSEVFGKDHHVESAEELQGSLVESGIPESRARYFDDALARGNVLVTVRDSGRVQEAAQILKRAGGDLGDTTATTRSSAQVPRTAEQGTRRIQLLGEVLRVHKERVQRGEVRLRKEIVTEKQNIEVPVDREELVIERTAGSGREATGQVGAENSEIRVPLSEERVRVEKKPVVNEEVAIGKRAVQDTKRVSDDVRHEELNVDKEGDVNNPEVDRLRTRNRKSA
jgi:uncharacterized protein (TIGR02271 family)